MTVDQNGTRWRDGPIKIEWTRTGINDKLMVKIGECEKSIIIRPEIIRLVGYHDDRYTKRQN